MLGYRVSLWPLREPIGEVEREAARRLPYPKGVDLLRSFADGKAGSLPDVRWIGGLLNEAEAGRAVLLHDGGYPYLIQALGSEVKAAFSGSALPEVDDGCWYLIEAWDRS